MSTACKTVKPKPVILPPLVQLTTPNVSSRHGATIDLFVLHETAGSYRGAVSWLRNPAARASAHLILNEDGDECTQLVQLSRKAWTQGSFNPRSVSLELANITAKGYHGDRQLRVAARVAAWVCWKYKLPPRWARRGVGRGLVYHGDLGARGGSHPACGPDPAGWQRFLEHVADELDRGGFRRTWARI